MIELVELERRHEDFARRQTRVIAISLEGRDEARQTQADFPHLLVLADADRNLANAAEVIHPNSGHDGGDTTAPTTIIVDGDGTVRWLYRPPRATERLSPDELLEAIDRHLPQQGA